MSVRGSQSRIDAYFQRFGFCGRQIDEPPADGLGIIVVVPCFDEPDLLAALESLRACERPGRAVEIIVVVNSAVDAQTDLKERNRKTAAQAREYAHVIHVPDLPPKHAGVGLARKIGMDEALRRLSKDGIIVNFDADCRCDPNYLQAIEEHFATRPETPGCSIYFEHPPGAADRYELHLRYYVQALRHARHPYAFHTIGSCMAVRSNVYMEQGGMNKRKAGEDFYFLQKVVALGNYTDLLTTRVIPSARESARVPFGTGNAVTDQRRGKLALTYPFEAFEDLKRFFENVKHPPPPMRPFLDAQNFDQKLRELRENTATDETCRDRFFRWFNGFMAMKWIHFARDHLYGARPVPDEARRLPDLPKAADLLSAYRQLQKTQIYNPTRRHQ
ncbi:MAG TPA: glycosyltransferase [Candidatus Binatia bacterium]|nr:glycosyltransferase [Candidatus Binatia bacterium]